ncbi:MAG: EscN/YscN/HrcN family type III secretion system ATPase [Micrococcales bacterium 70-64]|nr:FliI/YscN family ATPase [Leifsonia sp.]ODU64087.1 MAG: EscN/YscN/HrcN family type III secretion system ATPase [Leifsonia sp. SCN 70-46]OJX85778.1 MAG: EscN/YscN/HrcN family type III secretion system ATPase [Micrococcales bacterium 70-64]
MTEIFRPGRLDAMLEAARPERVGSVTSVAGLRIDIRGLEASIGDVVVIGETARAEVVAVATGVLTAMLLDPVENLASGTPVRTRRTRMLVPTGRGLLGRVLDGMGRPIDGKGPLVADSWVPVDNDVPPALDRARIDTPLSLGVRALDTLTTMGRGQRMGLFAGSGVGKSSLMSMIARGSDAELSVIALVGERGREVREFLEDDLGDEGLARSVVVVSTADAPALLRVRAAFTATRIAESFRDHGSHVMLMMDSLTRVAFAQREIGLSVGEPPATRGYPPSVFGLLGRLLERAGTAESGSITGLYTVLVEGDDHNEPIADAVRSILDGHVVLDRKLALAGHFPAIDVLASVSRVASRVAAPENRAVAASLKKVLAARLSAQDLLDVGAYQPGSNPLVDAAVDNQAEIARFLQQDMHDLTPQDEAWARLTAITRAFERAVAA